MTINLGDTMRLASGIAALAIVALGVWAVMSAPASTSALGAGPAWRQPASGALTSVEPSTAGDRPAGSPRIIHPEILVIEKPSPIIAPDGTLGESVGVEADDGHFLPILRKGQRIPVMEFLPVGSATGEQTELRFHILRGDSDTAAQNRSLAWVRISGLPPFEGPRPRASLMFAFHDGSIVMAAMDPKTGAPLKFELSQPWGQR